MSANKQVVRRVLTEVFEHGRLEVLDEVLTPGFVNHRTPPGVGNDIQGLKQIVTMERAAFPDLRYIVDREVEEDDIVVAVTTAEGTNQGSIFGMPPSGRRCRWQQIHIIRMEGGRMAEHWGTSDLASLWEQIGMVHPGPGPEVAQPALATPPGERAS